VKLVCGLVVVAVALAAAGCGSSGAGSETASPGSGATSPGPSTAPSTAVAPLDAVTAGEYCGDADASPIIHFPGRGTVRLAGVMLGHGTKAVLFAHQLNGDFCQWLPFAHSISATGTPAFVFSFRDALPSTGEDDAAGFGYTADLAAAAAELRRRGARRIVLVGASIGASAAIDAANRIRAEAVVALSPPASLGEINAARSAARACPCGSSPLGTTSPATRGRSLGMLGRTTGLLSCLEGRTVSSCSTDRWASVCGG
jgi:hypothetical protein